MIEVNFFNETEEDIITLERDIEAIFSHLDEDYAFSVIFVTEERIKDINKTYRKIDKVTDVISFPDREDNYLGDIFICLNQAKKQALDYEHTLKRETGFLAVHGYLHLLGYDHQTPEEEQVMFREQERILQLASLERIHHAKTN